MKLIARYAPSKNSQILKGIMKNDVFGEIICIKKQDKKDTVISFNDNDDVLDMGTNEKSTIHAPKTYERLEEISRIANQKRKEEEEEDDDDFDNFDDGPLNISDENISLDITDLQDLSPDAKVNNLPILEGVEVLA